MPFHLENLWMLLGLAALAAPILLHLLPRRHFDVVEWGAMQFLPDSVAAQRRRWLDEILLLLMRMAMIALIVIALATPISTSAWLAPLSDHSSRDVVLVIDGSYSMDVRVPGQSTPWDDAVRAAREHITKAPSSDRFAVLIAREPPLFVQEEFAGAFPEPFSVLPVGNPDMPRALSEAWKRLQTHSKATAKEIVVLTDQQHHGWADLASLTALENVGNQWRADIERARSDGWAVPSIRVVKVGAELPKSLPNYSLAPLTTSRAVAKLGQQVSFQSALHLDGFAKFVPPRQVKVTIDGKLAQNLSLPDKVELKQGQIPLTFQHRFETEGEHIVSLIVEADPLTDVLVADNEQRAIIEVVKELPILLIDGDKKLSPESSSYFLQRALASKRAVPYPAFTGVDADKPAVIVLADVPRLDAAQIDAIDRFLQGGGGLLIVAGARVAKEKAFYNEQLYRQGDGWLPAKLDEVASSKDGVQPEPRTFQHPALELFRGSGEGGMNQVRFSNWWKVALGPKDRAAAIGMLSNSDPFLIEKPYKKGRVILCTVPLDRRWNSTFPSAAEFPILVNELTNYLAGSRKASSAAPPDLRESDLKRCTEDDWRKVRERLPIEWRSELTQTIETADAHREELWWLLLLAVLGLLCTEVWMTRRMALARGR